MSMDTAEETTMTGDERYQIILKAIQDNWGRCEDETDLGRPYFRLAVLAEGVEAALADDPKHNEPTWKEQALRHCNRADELQREVEILRDQVNELDTNVGADSTQLVRMKQQCDAHVEAVENLTKLNDELRAELAALELWHGRAHGALSEICRRSEDMLKKSPPL